MERMIRDNLCTPSINIPRTTLSISGSTDAGEKFNLPENKRFTLPNVESFNSFDALKYSVMYCARKGWLSLPYYRLRGYRCEVFAGWFMLQNFQIQASLLS